MKRARTELKVQASAPTTGAAIVHPGSRRPISPRHIRAMLALLAGEQTREQIDRAAGASNGPDVIARIRKRFGLLIPCRSEIVKDRDGRKVERGTYLLDPADRPRIQALLKTLGYEGAT